MTTRTEKADLFEFMLGRIKETSKTHGLREPQAFGRWFLNMYFRDPHNIFISDGSRDGKVDIFFSTDEKSKVTWHVLNTKFTQDYSKLAPVAFYEEITYFWRAFDNLESRPDYLARAVKPELQPKYQQLFEAYDEGSAKLFFVTNHRLNENHYGQVEKLPVEVFHLDDLVQYLIDDLDGAMPRTSPITFNGIYNVPAPYEENTEVHTSIVFARLIDFIKYMQHDPYDLLFMRNVRVAISVGKSSVNRAIRDTFQQSPKEFAYSNNGITILCEKQTYYSGNKELVLENPRIVNGSQTLHSIRTVGNPSTEARVMVRIIEIPAPKGNNLSEQIARRKSIISKIAVRSNQQNPIKKWDLVSNDDFQLELYRFFRRKNLFYERRDREWNQRSRELKSVGVQRGPNIKHLTQCIASFYWNKKGLGPGAAKHSLGTLFEEEAYEIIRHTEPELVFQIYHVSRRVEVSCSDLAAEKKYVKKVRKHIDLAVFALVSKAFQEASAKWGTHEFTELQEGKAQNWTPVRRAWRDLTKECIDYILAFYSKDSRAYLKGEGRELTYVNYFKNQSYISQIIRTPVPRRIVKLAAKVLGAELDFIHLNK